MDGRNKHPIHHQVLNNNDNNNKNDVDINDLILKSGCSTEYYQLEECLCDNNRNWLKCQVLFVLVLIIINYYYLNRMKLNFYKTVIKINKRNENIITVNIEYNNNGTI